MRVLIPQGIADEGMQWLDERGYEIKIRSGTSIEASKTDVVDCSAILARTEPIPAEVLEAGECLRVVARHGVGCDNVDVKRAEELGIWVANAPESNANSVAEHAVLLMAALARSLPRIDAALRSGDFQIRDRELGVELAEKTVGVVGLGRIGLLVARKVALGLDMKVIAYDPFVKEMPDHVRQTTDWAELFRCSDFVTLHLPLTAETRGSVGAREFELMKPTAFLINAARGGVVDESALVAALTSGQIAGAGTDVYENEPPGKENPLFALENTIVTPHNGAQTRESMVRMALHAAQGIHEVLSGGVPTWPVNRPRDPRR